MLIADQKKKENIAEYILYMWQMEDLVRGSELNVHRVMSKLFPDERPEESVALEYESWFEDIVSEMKKEGIEKQGHLNTVRTHIIALNTLHQSLLMTYQDKKYQEVYKEASEDLAILKGKSGSDELNDVEICLTGLYGLMLLRIQRTTISEDTQLAMKRIGKLMAHLSNAYKRYESGELKLPAEMNN